MTDVDVVDTRDKPEDGGPPEYTDRTAVACVRNRWGTDLASITLRHRRSNDSRYNEEYTWYNLASGKTSPTDLKINYQTGFNAGFDYWWITFQLNNGDVYASKSSFFCNLTWEDAGRTVVGVVDLQGYVFTLECPVSDSCSTASIYKVGDDDPVGGA